MKAFALLAALSLACLAVPGAAQLSPGYSGQSSIRYMENEESFWALRELGACLAKSKEETSRTLLAATLGSEAEDRAVKKLMGPRTSCLRHANYLTVTRDMIRGVVAENLYLKAAVVPVPLVEARLMEFDMAEVAPGNRSLVGPRVSLADFAQCVAALHPRDVHDLLTQTKLGHEDERGFIAKMSPKFGPCVPEDVNIQIVPPVIRAALAEAIYLRTAADTGDSQERAE